MEFTPHEVRKGDERAREEVRALLKREGLALDKNLDYTIGLYDESYRLAATGSYFANTLRCLAVDSEYQGEGLMAAIVTLLKEKLFIRGISHIFLYTKPNAVERIGALGFYEIARVGQQVVLMENKRSGIKDNLEKLAQSRRTGDTIGSIIMNANPFTLGHQYLAETAAKKCTWLHLFVVSEDRSFFPFETRKKLIIAGTRHLSNIVYHDTGNYLISSAVFPSYFIKDEEDAIRAQASLDVTLFGKVSETLGISDRYVGDEPFSPTTNIYNEEMARLLPGHNVQLHIVPRKNDEGDVPVSATRVREALSLRDEDILKKLLPPSTMAFLHSQEGKMLVEQQLKSSQGITKG